MTGNHKQLTEFLLGVYGSSRGFRRYLCALKAKILKGWRRENPWFESKEIYKSEEKKINRSLWATVGQIRQSHTEAARDVASKNSRNIFFKYIEQMDSKRKEKEN